MLLGGGRLHANCLVAPAWQGQEFLQDVHASEMQGIASGECLEVLSETIPTVASDSMILMTFLVVAAGVWRAPPCLRMSAPVASLLGSLLHMSIVIGGDPMALRPSAPGHGFCEQVAIALAYENMIDVGGGAIHGVRVPQVRSPCGGCSRSQRILVFS